MGRWDAGTQRGYIRLFISIVHRSESASRHIRGNDYTWSFGSRDAETVNGTERVLVAVAGLPPSHEMPSLQPTMAPVYPQRLSTREQLPKVPSHHLRRGRCIDLHGRRPLPRENLSKSRRRPCFRNCVQRVHGKTGG